MRPELIAHVAYAALAAFAGALGEPAQDPWGITTDEIRDLFTADVDAMIQGEITTPDVLYLRWSAGGRPFLPFPDVALPFHEAPESTQRKVVLFMCIVLAFAMELADVDANPVLDLASGVAADEIFPAGEGTPALLMGLAETTRPEYLGIARAESAEMIAQRRRDSGDL